MNDIHQVFTEPCPCGNSGFRYKIVGRVDDMLKVKGVPVYPAAIQGVINGFVPRVTGAFRIVLDEPPPRVVPPLKLRVRFLCGIAGKHELPLLERELVDKMHSLLKIRPAIAWIKPLSVRACGKEDPASGKVVREEVIERSLGVVAGPAAGVSRGWLMKYVAVTRDVVGFRQPLPEEHIARLCQHAFGRDARPRTFQLMESGKFNTSYRVELSEGETIILRVAPPDNVILFRHEQLLLRRESAVQPILHTLSDKFPRNLLEDFTREHCDRDYVIQSCLPGNLWDDVKTGLSAVENESLWSQLAPIVRSVHAVPGKHFGFPRPMENFDRWSDAVIHWIRGMVEDMQRLQLPCADAQAFLSLVESGRRVLDEVIQPGLVHGDLWPKNVLVMRVADELQITGVLGCGTGLLGRHRGGVDFFFSGSAARLLEALWKAGGGPLVCLPEADIHGPRFHATVPRGLAVPF